jgi:hypothetical protein
MNAQRHALVMVRPGHYVVRAVATSAQQSIINQAIEELQPMTIKQVRQTTLANGTEQFFTPGPDIFGKISLHNGGLTAEQVKTALEAGHPVYSTFSRFDLVDVNVPEVQS